MVFPLDVVQFQRKGNSNFELGTAICYSNVENYFLTIIKHIAVPSSKLEFPFCFIKPARNLKLQLFEIQEYYKGIKKDPKRTFEYYFVKFNIKSSIKYNKSQQYSR